MSFDVVLGQSTNKLTDEAWRLLQERVRLLESALSRMQYLKGTKVFYVATTSGGSPTHKLTFIDGILVSEN